MTERWEEAFEAWYGSLDEEEFERWMDGRDKYDTCRIGARKAWQAALAAQDKPQLPAVRRLIEEAGYAEALLDEMRCPAGARALRAAIAAAEEEIGE